MAKSNPRRRVVTEADIKRAKRVTYDEAIRYCFAIFFTVLWDKENADMEVMGRVWDEINDLADSIEKGYVSVSDLIDTLKKDYGITLH